MSLLRRCVWTIWHFLKIYFLISWVSISEIVFNGSCWSTLYLLNLAFKNLFLLRCLSNLVPKEQIVITQFRSIFTYAFESYFIFHKSGKYLTTLYRRSKGSVKNKYMCTIYHVFFLRYWPILLFFWHISAILRKNGLLWVNWLDFAVCFKSN